MQKWSSYIKGDPKRQEILAEALEWVLGSQGISVDAYLAQHRHDTDITGLKTYFTSVIDWIGSVFTRPPDKEMRGLEWGRLYETYHSNVVQRGRDRRRRRRAPRRPGRARTARGSTSTCSAARRTRSCSTIRLFDETTKRAAYEQQTAEGQGRRRLQLPAVRGRRQRQQDAHLQAERDGRRPRDRLVEGREHGPRATARCSASRTTAPRATGRQVWQMPPLQGAGAFGKFSRGRIETGETDYAHRDKFRRVWRTRRTALVGCARRRIGCGCAGRHDETSS